MNTVNFLSWLKLGLSLVAIGLMGSTFNLEQTSLVGLKFIFNKEKTTQSTTFEPPNDGAPGRREDAGSRPGCPKTDKPFLALIPGTNLGVTAAEYPTFWLYIPYQSGVLELSLKDEQTKETIYRTKLEIKQGLGVIGFRLPSTAPPLKIGKKYRWKFDLFCRQGSESEFFSVNGVVVRQLISDKLRYELEKATAHERVNLYAAHGFWYDTLTELARLYLANSQDNILRQQWVSLLTHPLVQLEKISFEPIVFISED